MTNDINRNKLYMFLAEYNQNGNSWDQYVDKYYGNKHDGTVIKAEFREFMNKEFTYWNGETSLDAKNDIINAYWAMLDTSTSGDIEALNGTKLNDHMALNKTEIKNINMDLGDKQALNEHIAKLINDNPPGNFFTEQYLGLWTIAVKEALVDKANELSNNDQNIGNIKDALTSAYNGIAKPLIADYYARQVKDTYFNKDNGIFKEYVKDGGYKMDDDEALNKVIKSFIDYFRNHTDIANNEIGYHISKGINSYLATAGLDGMNRTLLDEPTEDDTKATELNDLQKAVAKVQIRNAIREHIKNTKYLEHLSTDDYKDLIDTVIDAFFNSVINDSTITYKQMFNSSDIKDKFKKSTIGNKLSNARDLYNRYFEINTDSNYFKQLSEYGEEIATFITSAEKGITDYKTVVDELIKDFLLSDETEYSGGGSEDRFKKMDAKLIDALKANINEIVYNGTGGEHGSLFKYNDPLQMTSLFESLEKLYGDDATEYRQSCEYYCDKLINNTNDGSAKIVKGIFSTNGYGTTLEEIKQAINDGNINTIKEIMKEIKDSLRIEKIENVVWNNTLTDLTLKVNGSEKTINADITAYIANNGHQVSLDAIDAKVEYSVNPKVINGDTYITIDNATGALTVTPGSKTISNKTITVTATIGNKTYTKEIKLNVTNVTAEDIITEQGSTTPIKNDSNYTLWELWDEDYIYTLHTKERLKAYESENHAAVQSQLNILLNEISTLLIEIYSFDSYTLTEAITKTENHFMNTANWAYYDNDNGDTEGELVQHGKVYFDQNRDTLRNKLLRTLDDDFKNYYTYQVAFKDVFEMVINKYYQMVA